MSTFITTILFTQLLAGASAGGETLDAFVTATPKHKSGTRIHLNRGSADGVEPGDRGQLLDGTDVVTRFTIDTVYAKSSSAFVPVADWEVRNLTKTAKIELTPGTTPPTLKAKEQGAGPLGSCATNYTMYKAGRISDWIPQGGSIRYLWIDALGWKHRVCKDSTGMIYLGGVGDQFVTDASDVKIRLRVLTLGYKRTFVEVIQGKLDEKLLQGNDIVVFRAKK